MHGFAPWHSVLSGHTQQTLHRNQSHAGWGGILGQGSPTSRPRIGPSCQISGSIRWESKCSLSVIRTNHAETIPPAQACKNSLFCVTGPWSHKSWGPPSSRLPLAGVFPLHVLPAVTGDGIVQRGTCWVTSPGSQSSAGDGTAPQAPWLAAPLFGLTELLYSQQHGKLQERQLGRPGPA